MLREMIIPPSNIAVESMPNMLHSSLGEEANDIMRKGENFFCVAPLATAGDCDRTLGGGGAICI